jgi:Leucine-rich repeat (LRR) protein
MSYQIGFVQIENNIKESLLSRLHRLNFDQYQQLTSLPESIGQLTQLKSLNISKKQLTSLPESIGQLKQLLVIELTGNQLRSLPESIGQLRQLRCFDLTKNQLTSLPESIGHLTQLQSLYLSNNRLGSLPESISQLWQLAWIELSANQLRSLPLSIGKLSQLIRIDASRNQLTGLPQSFWKLKRLETINLSENQLTSLPESIGQLTNLEALNLSKNQLKSLPQSVGKLVHLRSINLDNNPLNPELAAAYKQGFDTLLHYLREKLEEEIVLNESKLVLVGEGGVGKTSLLRSLKGEPFLENLPTTHGVEVDITSFLLKDPDSDTIITFNGWDFGGQNIYRHTHQLFFTAPAIYLVVWDPQRGPEICCVEDWIKMIKHRTYDESNPNERPLIIVVATHGGPQERLAHIDEIKIRNQFEDLIISFHHVDNRPNKITSERVGINDLKNDIARTAKDIQNVGRSVPVSWKRVIDAVHERRKRDAYVKYAEYESICYKQKVNKDLAKIYAIILNELGYLIHYKGISELDDTIILRPEWLSKAISFVLEDPQVKKQNGLVEHDLLAQLWDDPTRGNNRYPEEMHSIFLKLMEQFDLSYRVTMPEANAPETSLIAQLVPGGRPEDWHKVWGPDLIPGDTERTQVCRIIDAETGRTAEVKGIIYRLIVRLHRYSLGRSNYYNSKHWKTGMILEDSFNGLAFVEELDGDIRVSVRAAYPERFLHHLCEEVKWIVDTFWKGLDCQFSVPCGLPCKGLIELQEMFDNRKEGIDKVRCPICRKYHIIDDKLATIAPKPEFNNALAELRQGQEEIKQGIEIGLRGVRTELRRLVSQVDEQFAGLMATLTDLAKDGPRLFSFEAVDPTFFKKPKWVAENFQLTLWCEHARLPLPLLTGDDEAGVYDVELNRDWVERAAPVLTLMSKTLSLALPIAGSALQLSIEDAVYKGIEKQLDFGQKCAESFLEASEGIATRLSMDDEGELTRGKAIRAQGSLLRELHSLLKQKDPINAFGGLQRVQNKRREFLWVHPQYVDDY